MNVWLLIMFIGSVPVGVSPLPALSRHKCNEAGATIAAGLKGRPGTEEGVAWICHKIRPDDEHLPPVTNKP